jgi:hypothetical protein
VGWATFWAILSQTYLVTLFASRPFSLNCLVFYRLWESDVSRFGIAATFFLDEIFLSPQCEQTLM